MNTQITNYVYDYLLNNYIKFCSPSLNFGIKKVILYIFVFYLKMSLYNFFLSASYYSN